MASIYQPLGASLARRPGPTCVLTFGEIEARLGRPLPPSAGVRRDWWRHRHVASHAYHGWLAAGWRITSVDLARRLVTFRKG